MPSADTASSGRDVTDGGYDTADVVENVLVLAGSMDGTSDEYCAKRMDSPPGTAPPSALFVSLDGSPDRRLDAVIRRGAARPANVGVVCCDGTRGAAAAGPTGADTGAPDVTPGQWVATVSSPGDLTGLGVRIEEALSAWADDPRSVELCFHSLTTLCQYVDERTAFRFCHAVTRHLAATGASSHFHLDPDAVGERTVATLTALFDRVEDRT
jgi:hypothetical protein